MRAILQVQTSLIACLAYDEGPTTIQVWDLVSKDEIATVEHAHALEVKAMVNYYPELEGTQNPNPMDSSLFITAGNDKCLKVWDLENKAVHLIYII